MKWLEMESYFNMFKNQGYNLDERLTEILTDRLIAEVSTDYPKRKHMALNLKKLFNALGLTYCNRFYTVPEFNIKQVLFENALCMRSLDKDVYLTFQPFFDSDTIFNTLRKWLSFLLYMKNNNLRLDIYEGLAWDIRRPQSFMILSEIKGSDIHDGDAKIILHRQDGTKTEFRIGIGLIKVKSDNEVDWNALAKQYKANELAALKDQMIEYYKTGKGKPKRSDLKKLELKRLNYNDIKDIPKSTSKRKTKV